jgi:hypothetical protein
MIAIKSETVNAARVSAMKRIFSLHSINDRANGNTAFNGFGTLSWADLICGFSCFVHEFSLNYPEL